MSESAILQARRKLHAGLLRDLLTIDDAGVPANADRDSPASCDIAKELLNSIGSAKVEDRKQGQTLGKLFEEHIAIFVETTFEMLGHLRPGKWSIGRKHDKKKRGITAFDQYSHIADLEKIIEKYPELEATLGSDYLIKPDIMVSREPETDMAINKPSLIVGPGVADFSPLRAANKSEPTLHASISCKWTIRSDRSQNSRSEGLVLVRNRKGRLPHIAVVTAEPLPSRVASIALGTGDIDCVYHFALHELQAAVKKLGLGDAEDSLAVMVSGKRLRDISDLPLDLAT
jgi:NgoMIV restriction enzyme